MNNFRTYNAAVEFYRLTQALEMRESLKDQLLRAAESIALNLAEGRGRRTKNDQLRFFHIAMGSTRECQAALDLAGLKGNSAWKALDGLAAQLHRLIERAR